VPRLAGLAAKRCARRRQAVPLRAWAVRDAVGAPRLVLAVAIAHGLGASRALVRGVSGRADRRGSLGWRRGPPTGASGRRTPASRHCVF
jgi:hypothetical protein